MSRYFFEIQKPNESDCVHCYPQQSAGLQLRDNMSPSLVPHALAPVNILPIQEKTFIQQSHIIHQYLVEASTLIAMPCSINIRYCQNYKIAIGLNAYLTSPFPFKSKFYMISILECFLVKIPLQFIRGEDMLTEFTVPIHPEKGKYLAQPYSNPRTIQP